MKYIYSLLLLFAAVNYTTAQTCAGRYETEIFSSVDVTTYDYGSAVNMAGDTQILQLDLYTPIGDNATDRPVVIFCFGGSFYAGSRTSSELVQLATSFAKRGYVAASIDYRLANDVFSLINEQTMVKVVFGAVQDGKAAIRYFRKNFDEGNSFGIDADQIFIGGTSAGGILAINLAYVDSLHKLPANWQTWATEIGGMEGNSGNPGYCSYVSGVFGFAGAVGDTNYINANDVPFYGAHATGDQTVGYGYAKPLNGLAPVYLYGSGNMETRMNNLGIYNWVDTYNGSEHPPFGNGGLASMRENLSDFLYNILDCNPSNMKHSFQQDCNSFYYDDTTTTGIITQSVALEGWTVYPNPTNNVLNIEYKKSDIEQVYIYNVVGNVVKEQNNSQAKHIIIDVSNLSKGIYYIKAYTNKQWVQDKFVVK